MAKKLFISLPMQGKEIPELEERRSYVLEQVSEKLNEEFELIDTLWPEPEPDTVNHHTYYLGKSISVLSEADLVVFDKDWSKAKGCIIEYEICRLYKIPYYLLDFEVADCWVHPGTFY